MPYVNVQITRGATREQKAAREKKKANKAAWLEWAAVNDWRDVDDYTVERGIEIVNATAAKA